MRLLCLIALAILTSLNAQQAPTPANLEFEVASVKPANTTDPVFGLRIQPGRFSVTNATPEMLIGFAYALPNSQVAGIPKWAQLENFTIEAAISSATPITAGNGGVSQVMVMLQSLLANRFKLSSRKETRQMPVYELVVAKAGAKLTKSEDGRPPSRRIARGQLTGSMPIPLLATSVSQWVDRPVVDKTGLRGNYDVELTYSPEVGQGARFGPAEPDTSPANSNAPSLFSALREQLGLELKSERGPVEVLVVDHLERPEAN